MSFILRHSGWTHSDSSLSVFELMAGARCEHSVERINVLLPLAFTILHNSKGRYQIAVLSTSDHQKGEKLIGKPEAWIHPTGMTVDDAKNLPAFINSSRQLMFLFNPSLGIQANPIFRYQP